MTILKFRIHWEEDDSVYRDILIKPSQTFFELHEAILKSYDFDQKHLSTFFRSNDHWQRGREILLQADEVKRPVAPLMMKETKIAETIREPNQKFVYVYDFARNWTFLVELIGISKEKDSTKDYPLCSRKEGLSPSQYGTKGILADKMVEMEEKYDVNNEDVDSEGFGEEGEGLEGEEGSGSEMDVF